MPALSDECPAPQLWATATWTQDSILGELRASAAWLDPAHAHIYRSMGADDWQRAVALAADLMAEHATYQRHRPGGRRRHSSALHARLDRANEVQLVAAVAWVHAGFWLLPTQRQHGE